jgi:hypothetical protein
VVRSTNYSVSKRHRDEAQVPCAVDRDYSQIISIFITIGVYLAIAILLSLFVHYVTKLNAQNITGVITIKKSQYLRCALAFIDTISDAQFVYGLYDRKEQPNLLLASFFVLIVSLILSFILVMRLLKKKKDLLDSKILTKNVVVYFILTLFAIMDLEVIPFFPWLYNLSSLKEEEGFPDKESLYVTLVTIILENAPQLVIQTIYLLQSPRFDFVPVLSIILGSICSLLKIFRVYIINTFGTVTATTSEKTAPASSSAIMEIPSATSKE